MEPEQNAVATPQPAVAPQVDPVTERTREQFEKLLESNQRLFEQNEQLRQEITGKLTPPAPQPVVVPETQSQPDPWDFYETDPNTGETFINRKKLSDTMKQIQERASRAEEKVQTLVETSVKKQIEQATNEAFSTFPELDSRNKEKFDENFSRQALGLMHYSVMSPNEFGGKALTLKEAAQMIATNRQPVVQNTEPEQIGNPIKEASSAQVQSQPQNPSSFTVDEDLLNLRLQTRKGGDSGRAALAARLMHTEHIVPTYTQSAQN